MSAFLYRYILNLFYASEHYFYVNLSLCLKMTIFSDGLIRVRRSSRIGTPTTQFADTSSIRPICYMRNTYNFKPKMYTNTAPYTSTGPAITNTEFMTIN